MPITPSCSKEQLCTEQSGISSLTVIELMERPAAVLLYVVFYCSGGRNKMMKSLGKQVQLQFILFPWKVVVYLRKVRMAYKCMLAHSDHNYSHSKNIFFAGYSSILIIHTTHSFRLPCHIPFRHNIISNNLTTKLTWASASMWTSTLGTAIRVS